MGHDKTLGKGSEKNYPAHARSSLDMFTMGCPQGHLVSDRSSHDMFTVGCPQGRLVSDAAAFSQ